jgi:hypothetical protein
MSGLTKVSMNLSYKSMANIEELRVLIEEDNRTRIVSSALEISKEILKQVKNGRRIILRNKDGSEQEMNFIIT